MARTPQYVLNPSGVLVPLRGDVNGSLNINQLQGGNPLSVSNPVPSAPLPLAAALNGKLFAYSPGATFATTLQTTSGYPFSVFNPSNSGKNILLVSIIGTGNGSGTTYHINRTTADPAYNTAGNIASQQGGAAPPASVASVTYNNAALAWPAVYENWTQVAQNIQMELLIPGGILLPSGVASGVTVWIIPNGTVTEFVRVLGIEF